MERIRLSALVKDVENGGDIDVVIAAEAEQTVERCIIALAANGAPNCEAVKEAKAAIDGGKGVQGEE